MKDVRLFLMMYAIIKILYFSIYLFYSKNNDAMRSLTSIKIFDMHITFLFVDSKGDGTLYEHLIRFHPQAGC